MRASPGRPEVSVQHETAPLVDSTTDYSRARRQCRRRAVGNVRGLLAVARGVVVLAAWSTISLPACAWALPLGALVHDGPATPEQISLLLPVTGTLPPTA